MNSTYKPGWESREFHRLSRKQRTAIVREVDRLFREQNKLSRNLHPSSRMDRERRHQWLVLRDQVMARREEELLKEEMDFRRADFVSDVPGIVISEMRGMGWEEAPELMRIWEHRPPAIAPKYSAPVTHVIKMDWVLKFHRAKKVYDKIIKDRIWANEKSQERIAKTLKGIPRGTWSQPIGDLSRPVTKIDEHWVNSRPVGYLTDFDALSGALGRFHLQVAIAGKMVRTGDEGLVKVEEVGLYIKDSYDFNGSQFLGFWGHRDDPVSNEDYRQWRGMNNAGGDFRVFSDVKRVKINPPDVVRVAL
jgi:hypothetical protein